jgi:hypothetical protein
VLVHLTAGLPKPTTIARETGEMIRTMVAAAMAVCLPGCVLIWGGGYHVEVANPHSVSVQYDSHFASLADVQHAAQTRCLRYDKDAAARNTATSGWGITTIVFDCIARPK